MIILDTNIISELMKTVPDQNVVAWVNQQESIHLFITIPSIAEISYGLAVLPKGKRRDYLQEAFQHVLITSFKHRILAFDQSSAHSYGQLMGHRKNLGKPLSILDGQIASIAKVHQMNIATRNTKDFCDCELDVINPFKP